MEKLTPYELKRLENIRRNKERLAALDLPSIAQNPASTKRPRSTVVTEQLKPTQHTTVMTRRGKAQKRAANTSHPESSTRSRPEDIPNDSTDDYEEVEELDTEATKKNSECYGSDEEVEEQEVEATKRKGRGSAKGDKGYGMSAQVYRKRIITSDAARSIWPLFRTELPGPFVTWKEYPKKHLGKLFKLWRNKKFQFDCSEEELKDAFIAHIKRNYREWMSAIRKSVFSKHKTAAARYANNPSYVKPEIWTVMVDKWLHKDWLDVSEQNAINRDKLTMVHTTGSVPMAKYIKEEIDKTGVEPSPIEMFRRFHVSAPKDGKPEHWKSEKAKDLYESMQLKKHMEEVFGSDEEDVLDDWDIYQDECQKTKKGKILGLGGGMEPPESVCGSSGQTCNNSSCLKREEEVGQLKHQVNTVTDELAGIKHVIEALLARESPSSLVSSNSPTTAPASKSTPEDYEALAP